jgi:hypothetical protein
MYNSDYESFIKNIELTLFSKHSKIAYDFLKHSTNLKPHKKEGLIATCFYDNNKNICIGE